MNDPTDDSFGLIKFGEESWLKNIKDGKLWFRTLEYYQNFEADKNIGDKNEGISHIFHPDENTRFYFSHPAINGGKQFEILGITDPVCALPEYNRNTYIFCLSHFTVKDIIEKTIFEDIILEQKGWDSVFFFLDPVDFVDTIKKSLNKNNPIIHKIQYFDYSKNQNNLNVFSKSEEYSSQKEIRIALQYSDKKDQHIKQIRNDTIEVTLDKKIEGVIMPTASFREGFVVKNL
jgi:hypothetical protein